MTGCLKELVAECSDQKMIIISDFPSSQNISLCFSIHSFFNKLNVIVIETTFWSLKTKNINLLEEILPSTNHFLEPDSKPSTIASQGKYAASYGIYFMQNVWKFELFTEKLRAYLISRVW